MIEPTAALCLNGSSWLIFDRPCEVVSTTRQSEVADCLGRIERYTDQGYYAAGFISYEAGTAFDGALEVHPADTVPLIWFGIFKHVQTVPVLPGVHRAPSALSWQPSVTYDEYISCVNNILEQIAAGATYQVNYTFRLTAPFAGDPWEYFSGVASRHPAPHAGYVNAGRYRICSFSPELFFSRNGNELLMQPMKGTSRRGGCAEEDRELERRLKTTAKERAENIMIVDMIRNDMGKLARCGSVQVTELCGVRRFPTVLQMVSTVEAKVTAGLPELMGALFPSASVTGAPKVRTCSIIRQLETTPRHVYCGTVGWMGPGRRSGFNVAIRTVLVDTENNCAEYGTGSGIVGDSVPEAEFGECLIKTAIVNEHAHPSAGTHGLFGKPGSPSGTLSGSNITASSAGEEQPLLLIETMLWTRSGGWYLLDEHIERLLRTAVLLKVPCDGTTLARDIEQTGDSLSGECYRVRLTVDLKGRASVESTEIVSGSLTTPLTIHLTDRPVESSDPYLYVKTTRRRQYAAARKRIGTGDDLLFFNERSELTELSIGNLVVRMGDGICYTPPIRCGLLPGVFRKHLLASGSIVERLLTVKDLERAENVYRINSVRKWQECRITPV